MPPWASQDQHKEVYRWLSLTWSTTAKKKKEKQKTTECTLKRATSLNWVQPIHSFLPGGDVQHRGGEHIDPGNENHIYIVIHLHISIATLCCIVISVHFCITLRSQNPGVTWTIYKWVNLLLNIIPSSCAISKRIWPESIGLWQKVPWFAFVSLETIEELFGVDIRNINVWLNCRINDSITVQVIILTNKENYPAYFIPSYLAKTSM